tara:strand:+ start:23456 stop:24706 length:1251 start_codon:yes stop_codon:yes gene_type:complete
MKFFFFFKRISDLDHIVPIIYTLVRYEVDSKKIILFNIEPDKTLLDIEKDPRAVFLKKLGIEIKISYLRQLYLNIIQKIINPSQFNFFLKILRRLFYSAKIQNSIKNFSLRVLIKDLESINYSDQDIFILDHSVSNSNLEVLKFANKNKLKKISVPHGLITHEGLLIEEHNNLLFKENKELEQFDKIIFSNESEFKRSKISSRKKVVLGSARFSKEWHEKLKTVYEPLHLRDDNKINVLLLAEKDGRLIGNNFVPDIIPEEIKKTVSLLDSYANVNLMIKHHPSRTGQYGADDLGPYASDKALHVLKDKDGSTFQLIRECDLVLTTFSSAAIDAFLSKKRVLVLEFASPYKLVYRNFPEIELISKFEILEEIFTNLDNYNLEISSESYGNFLKEYVEKDTNNLENYFNFLMSLDAQ